MSRRFVLNYPLEDQHYAIHHRSIPMATQHSSGSTGSNWSHTSLASFQSQTSSQHFANSKHTASTPGTNQYSSYASSCGQNASSQYPGVPTSPSDKSDRESKEPQYCTHPDCLDSSGRPTRAFSRKADVGRHHKTTHEVIRIDCPRTKCNRKGPNGFTRMDHLKEHQRGYHGDNIPKRPNGNDAGSRHAY